MTVMVRNTGQVAATVSLVPQPVSAFGEVPPQDPRDLARRSSEGIPGEACSRIPPTHAVLNTWW